MIFVVCKSYSFTSPAVTLHFETRSQSFIFISQVYQPRSVFSQSNWAKELTVGLQKRHFRTVDKDG